MYCKFIINLESEFESNLGREYLCFQSSLYHLHTENRSSSQSLDVSTVSSHCDTRLRIYKVIMILKNGLAMIIFLR